MHADTNIGHENHGEEFNGLPCIFLLFLFKLERNPAVTTIG